MFKKSAIASALIIYSPLILGLLGSLLVISPRFLALSLYAIGLFLFLIAKISNFSKEEWISFGSSGMGKPFKMLYKTGYAFMIFSVGLSAMILMIQSK